MKKHREQHGVRRFFRSRLFFLSIAFLTLFVLINYIRGYYQEYKIREEIKTLQNDVVRLEKKKIESLEILDYVMSPDFVEEKARTELNMKKPGEQVLVISEHTPLKTDEQAPAEDTPEEGLNNPMRWWYYFLK